MKTFIIGAGAVGLTVASALEKIGEVNIICDGERAERYSKGLFFNGQKMGVRLSSPTSGDKADLLIVAVKNFQLSDAIEDIRGYVKEDTVILPLLNGIDAERILSDAFGEDKVLYGFITDLSANHEGNTTICFSNGGTIVFGEKDNQFSPRVENICHLFDEAGLRYLVPENILHEKWWKFCLNVCFNTLTAILGADYSQVHDNREIIRAFRLMAKEVQQVAEKEGVNLCQEDIEEILRRFTRLDDHGKTSMLQDVEAGRNTENQFFTGTISRLGHYHEIRTPYCDFAGILLEAKRHVLSKS